MSISSLIKEYLDSMYFDGGLTMDVAHKTAHIEALISNRDKTDMAKDSMFSYRYTYKDDSALIIDDKGYIYMPSDTEINRLVE